MFVMFRTPDFDGGEPSFPLGIMRHCLLFFPLKYRNRMADSQEKIQLII